MSNSPKIKFAVEIFERLADRNNRLYNGALRRREIVDAIAKGDQPTGYRVDWLQNSATRVCSLLAEIANEFDKSHQDDQSSIADMLDILEVAKSQVRKA